MLSTRHENGFHQQKWIKNKRNVKKMLSTRQTNGFDQQKQMKNESKFFLVTKITLSLA